ncbi:transposase [Streptomyces sp. B8F3]|uniref:transposase n=1 Tax=unclassified Streptomyces TaxID=2593676 RepID=UPI00325CD1B5
MPAAASAPRSGSVSNSGGLSCVLALTGKEVAHPEQVRPHRPSYGGPGPPTLPRYRTPPQAVPVLAAQAGAGRFTEVTWRQSSEGAMTSRFAVLTVRPAGKSAPGRGPGSRRRPQPVGRCPTRPDPPGRTAGRTGHCDRLLDRRQNPNEALLGAVGCDHAHAQADVQLR